MSRRPLSVRTPRLRNLEIYREVVQLGRRQVDVGRQHGVSQQRVGAIVKVVRRFMAYATNEQLGELPQGVQLQLAMREHREQLRLLLPGAWESWNRSQQPATSVRTVEGPKGLVTTKTIRSQNGSAPLLSLLLRLNNEVFNTEEALAALPHVGLPGGMGQGGEEAKGPGEETRKEETKRQETKGAEESLPLARVQSSGFRSEDAAELMASPSDVEAAPAIASPSVPSSLGPVVSSSLDSPAPSPLGPLAPPPPSPLASSPPGPEAQPTPQPAKRTGPPISKLTGQPIYAPILQSAEMLRMHGLDPADYGGGHTKQPKARPFIRPTSEELLSRDTSQMTDAQFEQHQKQIQTLKLLGAWKEPSLHENVHLRHF